MDNSGGGGIRNSNASNPTLTNCTISGNTASGGSNGGGIRSDGGSNPTVTDSVVCGNEPNQINGSFVDGGGNIVWPYCPPPGPLAANETCLGDMDGDGTVGINDFLDLLAAWGPCK